MGSCFSFFLSEEAFRGNGGQGLVASLGSVVAGSPGGPSEVPGSVLLLPGLGLVGSWRPLGAPQKNSGGNKQEARLWESCEAAILGAPLSPAMGPRPLLASLSLPSLEDPQCLEGTPVDRVLSQFLHLLATGTPGSSSTKASLVQDLGAILEVASCQWLLRRDPTYASFGLLGKVADALCQYAAPSQQGGQPNSCADRGAATSLVFCSILDKVDKAKDTEGLGTPVASAALHQITGPVFVFAITHVAEQPWSNPRTRPKAQEVLEGLLRVSGCRSVPEFLRGAHDDQEGWFAEVMRYLKPELTKETWQRNPATKFVFASMLQQVTRPWLSQHLENVLPPSLLLSDDYRVENKILGVQCLHHIIRNVASFQSQTGLAPSFPCTLARSQLKLDLLFDFQDFEFELIFSHTNGMDDENLDILLYHAEEYICSISKSECHPDSLLLQPAADLCQFNRVQVVNHALSIHLYNKEPQVMQIVLLCILDLLPILEKASRQQSNDAPFVTPYDEVLQLVLTHMEAEHQLSLRRVYARNLPTFVERLGIQISQHLKRLQRVIVGYLEISDGPEETARLAILDTLKCTIQHAWPRMTYHLSVLLKALLRMMWDVATDRSSTPEPVKKELLQRATECLLLLDHSTCGQVKVLLQGVYQHCQNDHLKEYLKKLQVEPAEILSPE